jgi:hypothetical protein
VIDGPPRASCYAEETGARQRGLFGSSPLGKPDAQHHAGATDAPDARTQVVGAFKGVGADADLVEGLGAAAAEDRAQDACVFARQNLGIAARDRGIGRKHTLARESGAELNAPGAAPEIAS